jgi:putative ABC transport system permease protein
VAVWSAIRYRRLQALVLLALSAVITACAVVAPLYDRAMQQALTRLTVDSAPTSATAIQIRSLSRFAFGVGSPAYAAASLDQLAGLLPAPARSWFQPPIRGVSLLVTRADQTQRSPVGVLQWRDGACEHVTWLAGSCPVRIGDIAVTAADQKNFGLAVGSTVEVAEQPTVEQERPLPVVQLRVTGVYRQAPAPYWDEQVLAGVSGSVDTQPPYRPAHDTWLTAQATFRGSDWLDPVNSVTYNLDRPAAGVDRMLRAGSLVTGMARQSAVEVDDLGQSINPADAVLADVQSRLPDIGATIDRGREQALVTVPLLMVQLGLLALFVLGLTLGAAVEQRRPEVAVARLRGAGRAGGRRLVLAELLPVVLVGVPVGVAAGLGLAAVARHTVLDGAAPFELGAGFWLAVGGAALLLTALTWAAVASGTKDGIAALLRSVPTRRVGWGLGVVDAVVIAAAGTAVLAFATGNLTGPWAAAAPALLALIAGLLLAHLIVPVANRAARRLSARGAYAAALALLAVARRPVTRRVVTVVTVASALLVFSTYAVSVGGRNRELAAQRDNGAPMVATLTGTDVTKAETVLAGAGGGHVTPVVRVTGGKSFRTTLAVDPEDFGRIALLPDADLQAVPWSQLRVPTGRRLALTGSAVSLRVTPDGFRIANDVAAHLQLQLLDALGQQKAVDLGPIPTRGLATLGSSVPCEAGCTVVQFSIAALYGTAYSGRLGISGVRAAGGRTDLPGAAADWRAGVVDASRVEAAADAPGALTLRASNDGKTQLGVTSRFFPPALPAVVAGLGTRSSATRAAGTVLGTSLNGSQRTLTGVGSLPRAPAVEGPAAVVDLDLLRHWGSRAGSTARLQAWFDTEDPAVLAAVRTALQRAGIEISGVRRVSDVRDSYDASVPAWSLQLGVVAAAAGLLLAALVLVLLVASTWRRRSRDLACLGLTGVPRRGLGRVAVGEQLPVVLLAILVGAGCGLLGAVLALPTVPLFAQPRDASTLDLSAPWGSVLAVLAAALVVLGLVAWLCGRTVLARARLSRVREVL